MGLLQRESWVRQELGSPDVFANASTSQPRSIQKMEGLNRKPKMSCRIDRVVSAESLVVLLVSGGITGEHVDMFRGVLEQESDGFVIDLKNVLLVDREAVKLLALSEAHGTELRNCPPYIREWVTRERAEAMAS